PAGSQVAEVGPGLYGEGIRGNMIRPKCYGGSDGLLPLFHCQAGDGVHLVDANVGEACRPADPDCIDGLPGIVAAVEGLPYGVIEGLDAKAGAVEADLPQAGEGRSGDVVG